MKTLRKQAKPKLSAVKVFIKVFIIAMIVGLLIVGGLFTGALMGLMGNIDEINVEDLTLNFTSHIVYIDPETKEEKILEPLYDEQNRIWADFDKIPQYLKDAIVAVEDERYYEHNGFDLKRTVSATMNYFVNRDSSYGGSTITQQLIKNITGDEEQTPSRKIQEISRAVNLEKKLSKDQILELYLNTIYLSQGCNGVQSASETYFSKELSALNLAECASIAGITQFPSKYDPFEHPKANKEKQETVLMKMLELGYISQEEHDEAVSFELVFTKEKKKEIQASKARGHFADQVVNDVIAALQNEKGYSKTLANKMLFTGGLKIYATYDPKVQNSLEKVYKNLDNFPKVRSEPAPQSAMVVIDNSTGAVVGLVGEIGEKSASMTLNRATQSTRQPGSTIKPIAIYAPALENNVINMGSVYDDKLLTINGWTPQNYSRRFSGPVTIKYAVEQSLNTVPVQILQKMSPETSFDFMTNKLGITSLVRGEKRADGKTYTDIAYATLALGGLTDGISPLELCAAYEPFATKGVYTKPYTFTKVVDNSGKEILVSEKKSSTAMSESTAYLMTQLLRGVVENGTGGGARISTGIVTCGKTGTTSDNFDRWFAGFTPYYTAVTWYGYDIPKEVVASGNPCIPVWKKVMDEIHKGKPNKNFDKPSNLTTASVCQDSGKLVTDLCKLDERGSRVASFTFVTGTIPRDACDKHISVEVCGATAMKATDFCPTEDRVVKGILKDAPKKGDETPLYEQYCTQHTTPAETQEPDDNIETHNIDDPPFNETSQPATSSPLPPVSDLNSHPPVNSANPVNSSSPIPSASPNPSPNISSSPKPSQTQVPPGIQTTGNSAPPTENPESVTQSTNEPTDKSANGSENEQKTST